MGGRPRKPTQTKIAEGNRGKRKLDISKEPQFPREIPEPPDFLSPDAAAEWRELSGLLFDAGLLTKVDGKALAAYCETYAVWKGLHIEFRESKQKYCLVGVGGAFYKNPMVSMINEASCRMLKYLHEFGLTPASRSKITITKKDLDKDPFEEFQNQREEMRGKLYQIAGAD